MSTGFAVLLPAPLLPSSLSIEFTRERVRWERCTQYDSVSLTDSALNSVHNRVSIVCARLLTRGPRIDLELASRRKLGRVICDKSRTTLESLALSWLNLPNPARTHTQWSATHLFAANHHHHHQAVPFSVHASVVAHICQAIIYTWLASHGALPRGCRVCCIRHWGGTTFVPVLKPWRGFLSLCCCAQSRLEL